MTKSFITLGIVTVFLLLMSCTDKPKELKIEVTKHISFPSLSSASGIAYVNNLPYLVGDDIPWMYIFDSENHVSDKVKLSSITGITENRMPKSIKADFESMEKITIEGRDYLLILSSGSTKIKRDTAYLVSLDSPGQFQKRNLRPVYEEIVSAASISDKDEINIEGLAIDETHAYLLHRGNVSGNFIAMMDKNQFVNYLTTDSAAIPEVKIYQFDLPVYKNLKSGFSGACLTSDNKGILFTASLEETDDVINDGKVLGSYLGIIPIDRISKGDFNATLVRMDGEILAKKMEGISIKESSGNQLTALVVCDNDDGSSDLYEMKISF